MDRESIPPSFEAKKLSTSSKELVSYPNSTPNHDLGDPNTPGFVIYHLFKLRVSFLDLYGMYLTL